MYKSIDGSATGGYQRADDDRREASGSEQKVSATTLRYLESIGAYPDNTASSSSSSRHPDQQERREIPSARKDIPSIVLSTRGNLNTALAAASDVELRQRMLENYLLDKHALSAQASQDSLDNTWKRLHRAWFGESSRPFPTNVSAIRAIAASMKFAKYRSFDNYASRAKRSHIEAGGVWTQDLELEVKDASRSVNRGKGPDRQSAPLQLERIFDMDPNRFFSKDRGR